jgi:hypothetical protein
MPEADEKAISQAVDEVLEPAWARERRRWLGGSFLRLVALLGAVTLLSLALGAPPRPPQLIFFGLLGALVVLGPAAPFGASRRRNRTRIPGS